MKHRKRYVTVRRFLPSVAATTLVALASAGIVSVSTAAETGTIAGNVVDEQGRPTLVGNAVVFLCDARGGLPILSTTREPLVPDRHMDAMKDIWFEVTSDEGKFEFKDVRAGRYRLVAQAWSGTRGLPTFEEEPSATVVLHGVAENVEVKAGEVVRASPRKLGDGMLKIVNDPEEEHAFLLISRKPRLGDGVLGPAAWGDEFLSGLIGVTRMETPHVTLVGLPDGAEIHVGLFNYDNNPGVGGDSYVVGRNKEVRLNVYATWSNGKHEPPERLAKLTDHLEQRNLTPAEVLGAAGVDAGDRQKLYDLLRTQPDRMVEVPDVGRYRLADILAAATYRSLRESHRARKARARK